VNRDTGKAAGDGEVKAIEHAHAVMSSSVRKSSRDS
jgi:hypothetical protein